MVMPRDTDKVTIIFDLKGLSFADVNTEVGREGGRPQPGRGRQQQQQEEAGWCWRGGSTDSHRGWWGGLA